MKMGIGGNICLCLGGILLSTTCIFAQAEFLKTTISDIQRNPAEFYGKEVEVQAYFHKTDDLWARSLEQPDQYIGVFVMKPEKDTSPVMGEYFGFIFAPLQMRAQIRSLKSGDEITIRGKCFEFRSISIDGPGIEASELLSEWTKSPKPATADKSISDFVEEILREKKANKGQ